MDIAADQARERAYVEGLRWRHQEVGSRLAGTRSDIERLSQIEGGLARELAAIEELLATADRPLTAPSMAVAGSGMSNGQTVGAAMTDLSGVGPTARRIYASAEQVLRDAGVPLHYRRLAEEIQKTVPLSGADPGATLIAHLHRAPDRFPRVGRGLYAIPEFAPPQAEPGAGGSAPAGRHRQRVRRRTK